MKGFIISMSNLMHANIESAPKKKYLLHNNSTIKTAKVLLNDLLNSYAVYKFYA
jgi:hypothetical protein